MISGVGAERRESEGWVRASHYVSCQVFSLRVQKLEL